MRTARKQDGENIRSDFSSIGRGSGISFNPGLPDVAMALQLDNVSLPGDTDLELHGTRSSCSRRPSSFQREALSLSEEMAGGWAAVCFACQTAAAMAAASFESSTARVCRTD